MRSKYSDRIRIASEIAAIRILSPHLLQALPGWAARRFFNFTYLYVARAFREFYEGFHLGC
jgi:hypothetical protein